MVMEFRDRSLWTRDFVREKGALSLTCVVQGTLSSITAKRDASVHIFYGASLTPALRW